MLKKPFDDLNAITRLIELRKQGKNVSDIARYFEVSYYTLLRVMRMFDISTEKLHNGKRKDFSFMKERWIQKPTVVHYTKKREPKKEVVVSTPQYKYKNILEEPINKGHDYEYLLKKQGYKKPKIDSFNRIRTFQIKESPH